MNELINLLQANFKTILVLLGGTGTAISAYLYNTRHYRYGYQIGKKVTERLGPEIAKILTSSHSQKTMQDRVGMVKDMVFQSGFSAYIKDYDQTVGRLEEQISSLKKELENKKESNLHGFKEENEELTKEMQNLESLLKTKEEELFQLRKDEDRRNEALEETHKTQGSHAYFFSKLLEHSRNSLKAANKSLERDLIRYMLVLIVILLLAGDFYITYFIFSDVLKIQFKDNKLAIYLFSGIIALVFVVLVERALEFLEKSEDFRKYIKQLQTISMLVVGAILFTIYILMVSLSWLSNIPEALDSLLRLLFVPLIVAVALTIRKVQREYGFSFLFTPIKVVLYLLLIVISNLLLLFEVITFYIRRYIQKEKFESKTKLTIAQEVENIKKEILQKSNLQTILKERLEIEISSLTEEYQKNISKLDKKIDVLNSEMVKIKKGCNNGFISTFSLNKAAIPSR